MAYKLPTGELKKEQFLYKNDLPNATELPLVSLNGSINPLSNGFCFSYPV